MERREWLARRFEEQRPHLLAVAYRMLGSLTEADDAVQESWLRLDRTDGAIDDFRAWLTTVVGRICLDMLRARRACPDDTRPWVPEPIVSDDTSDDPEEQVLAARFRQPRAARRPRAVEPGRAGRVRPARRLRHAVRRHRTHRRSVAGRDPSAREPCPSDGPRRHAPGRDRHPRPTPRGRRVPRGVTLRRLRSAPQRIG